MDNVCIYFWLANIILVVLQVWLYHLFVIVLEGIFFSRWTQWTHCSRSSERLHHWTKTILLLLVLFTGVVLCSTASNIPSSDSTAWMTWWLLKWENRSVYLFQLFSMEYNLSFLFFLGGSQFCVCVCMCVCVHACMRVCVSACMHERVNECESVCVCVCLLKYNFYLRFYTPPHTHTL